MLTATQVAVRLGVEPKRLRRAIRRDGRWAAPYVFTPDEVALIAELLSPSSPPALLDAPGRPASELSLLKHDPRLRCLYRALRRERVARLNHRLDELGLLGCSESNPDHPPRARV